MPEWLDEEAYKREILPRLERLTVKAIRLRLDVSHPYATLVKRGLKIPHPRHWMALAELAGYRSIPFSNFRRSGSMRMRATMSFNLPSI
jgi:hypothetical protein